MKMLCLEPGCGGRLAVKRRRSFLYSESGISMLLVGIDVQECCDCKGKIPVIPNIVGLYACVADLIAQKTTLLTGAEIKFLRKQLDLNVTKMAGKLKISREWLSTCESGKKPFGQHLDSLVRMIYWRETGKLNSNLFDLALAVDHTRKVDPSPYRVPLELLNQQSRQNQWCTKH